jgi:energy-coupling factor transporter ATP-binding protein EcfA2
MKIVEQHTIQIDIIDVVLAVVVFGTTPTTLIVIGLILQYIIRHNDEVKAVFLNTIRILPDVTRKSFPLDEKGGQTSRKELKQSNSHGIHPTTITLSSIAKGDNILLIGGKGTGKTTLLNALIAARSGTLLVLDPHYSPGDWARATTIVGAGRNYQSIETALKEMQKELDGRYQSRSHGEGVFDQITLCGDEWRSISKNIEDAGRIVTALATEGRKVRITLLAASHNDTVGSLGTAGDKEAFLSSFDFLIYLGVFASRRFGDIAMPFIKTSNGNIPAFAYVIGQNEQRNYTLDMRSFGYENSGDDTFLRSLLANETEWSSTVQTRSYAVERENDESIKTARVCELVHSGMGKARAIESVWGCKKGSSSIYVRAKDLLEAALQGIDQDK